MQSKDIPITPVLEFLEAGATSTLLDRGPTGTLSIHADGSLYPNSVQHGMPAGVPKKLARAKMASLIRQGLVNGCVCGCRGDFELTEKGLARLAATPARLATPARG